MCPISVIKRWKPVWIRAWVHKNLETFKKEVLDFGGTEGCWKHHKLLVDENTPTIFLKHFLGGQRFSAKSVAPRNKYVTHV